jgi:thymidylate synthase (FAD)
VKIIREPTIYLVGRSHINQEELDRFLSDHETSWQTDTEIGAEQISELSGRLCYFSFGRNQGRKTNHDYLENILKQEHGSVIEHAVWNFIITGVSRSFSHELVRHRAGVAISQISQRYVDESEVDFVEPEVIAGDPEMHAIWEQTMQRTHEAYVALAERLAKRIEAEHPDLSKREKRKMAREAARSVLPNATETKISFSANTRALRHIIELRGAEGTEPEIRRFAVKLLRLMQKEAPNLFGDIEIVTLPDGSEGVKAQYHKV